MAETADRHKPAPHEAGVLRDTDPADPLGGSGLKRRLPVAVGSVER
jgi:hypothetical protein